MKLICWTSNSLCNQQLFTYKLWNMRLILTANIITDLDNRPQSYLVHITAHFKAYKYVKLYNNIKKYKYHKKRDQRASSKAHIICCYLYLSLRYLIYDIFHLTIIEFGYTMCVIGFNKNKCSSVEINKTRCMFKHQYFYLLHHNKFYYANHDFPDQLSSFCHFLI